MNASSRLSIAMVVLFLSVLCCGTPIEDTSGPDPIQDNDNQGFQNPDDGGQGYINSDPIPAEFIGTWYYGNASLTNYQDYLGHWESASGEGYQYTFYSDGTYQFAYFNYVNEVSGGYRFVILRVGTMTYDGYTLTLYDSRVTKESLGAGLYSDDPSYTYGPLIIENYPPEALRVERTHDEFGNPGLLIVSSDGSSAFYIQQ